jgi:hypothetical protein
MSQAQRVTDDKTTWGPGPWQEEPDRVEWRDEATGYPCLALRNVEGTGAWCGYVGVPPGHPYHGKAYRDVAVEVHGGLTYADACQEGGHICHVPLSGESADIWWFGFDCGHCFDLMPRLQALLRSLTPSGLPEIPKVYRDLDYVRGEVTALAEQLAAVR